MGFNDQERNRFCRAVWVNVNRHISMGRMLDLIFLVHMQRSESLCAGLLNNSKLGPRVFIM